jgi:hypothetical protein
MRQIRLAPRRQASPDFPILSWTVNAPSLIMNLDDDLVVNLMRTWNQNRIDGTRLHRVDRPAGQTPAAVIALVREPSP